MKKKKINEEAERKENIKEPIWAEEIANFVNENEIKRDYVDKLPIMTRIDILSIAMLDHLAVRWRKTKSGLACEILEKMIYALFRELYKDQTDEEINRMYFEIMNEYVKRKSVKEEE